MHPEGFLFPKKGQLPPLFHAAQQTAFETPTRSSLPDGDSRQIAPRGYHASSGTRVLDPGLMDLLQQEPFPVLVH